MVVRMTGQIIASDVSAESATEAQKWKRPPYTPDQVRALPATATLADAARSWGISEAQVYRVIREKGIGGLPFPVIQVGKRRYQVRRSDLMRSLGIEEIPGDPGQVA
jgi:hypothetical protein